MQAAIAACFTCQKGTLLSRTFSPPESVRCWQQRRDFCDNSDCGDDGENSDIEVPFRRKHSGPRRKQTGEGKSGKTNPPDVEKLSAAVREIKNIAITLGAVYSASVALRLALQGQNAEEDLELAQCVRLQISNVIDDLIERLVGVGRRLGGTITNPLREANP